MAYSNFLNLNYQPKEEDLICLFKIEPEKGFSIEEAAARVASESSNGTWTDLTTMTEEIRKLSAKVFEIKGNLVKIAYPIELFEPGNMPQIVSSIAGNVFGMKAVKNLRLEDVYWPEQIVISFKGPKLGISGIRKMFKIYNRPLTATVPKPKVGMTSKEHAQVAYQIWTGGVDIVKDDENLSSQKFNRFEERIKETLKMRDKAENETGEKKGYLPNISSETKEMIKRAEKVAEEGGEYVMIDILTTGWASLQTLREKTEELGLAIHAHRAFHAAFTRNPKHGVSMKVIAEISRLIGVDQLHVGTVVGKLESPLQEVKALIKILREEEAHENSELTILKKKFFKLKPVLPVSSGGLHPGLIPKIIEIFGKEVLIQAGGGVLGHPDGPKSGAAALRQAINATISNISLKTYAEEHKELKTALEKWGFTKPK